jgi:hypothetical protein
MNPGTWALKNESTKRLVTAVAASVALLTTSCLAADKSPWERIAMIGASVTSGFVQSEPLGGTNTEMHKLSRYLEAGLVAQHEPIKVVASPFLFLQPETVGPQQVQMAIAAKPTLVIGLDFLFWSCYGEGKTDEDRLQRFEKGLKLLEQFDCALVVGDLPDASAAVGGMLRADQMPSDDALKSANKRLKEWATARKQVTIIPLSDFMRNAVVNKEIKIGGFAVPEGKSRALLQRDKLHPSPPGCSLIALAILESVQATRQGDYAKDIRHDAKEIFQIVSKSTKSPTTAESKPASTAAPAAN